LFVEIFLLLTSFLNELFLILFLGRSRRPDSRFYTALFYLELEAICLGVAPRTLPHRSQDEGPDSFVSIPGGVPITVNGEVVGAVAVSGAGNKDEEIAKSAASLIEK
jgi:hypothetical protein